ncbi:MAG: YeeE/YedE thiosulfate transporter family protein [Rhodospirillales bacterium]
MTLLILAIVIGGAFGFVLDRVGATNPGLIIRMLNLSNMHLMKTILLAIGLSSVLMFAGLLAGLIDVGHMDVKTAYVGVFVGGLLLGAGFAVSGFCPGTGLTAAATGRKDAMIFVLGGLAGAGAYMGSFAWIGTTGLLEKVAGGNSTLGAIAGTEGAAMFPGLPGEWIGILVGIAFIAIAAALPARLLNRRRGAP